MFLSSRCKQFWFKLVIYPQQWAMFKKRKNRGFVRKKTWLDLRLFAKWHTWNHAASHWRVWWGSGDEEKRLSNMAPAVSLFIKKTCVSCRVVWLYLKEVCVKITLPYPESCSRFLSCSWPECKVKAKQKSGLKIDLANERLIAMGVCNIINIWAFIDSISQETRPCSKRA